MINNNDSLSPFTLSGNPSHPDSLDNLNYPLSHQSVPSATPAPTLAPTAAPATSTLSSFSADDLRQLAAAVQSAGCITSQRVDLHLKPHQPAVILEPYPLFEEALPSFTQSKELFNMPQEEDNEEYLDVKTFPRVRDVEYTAPPLPSNIQISDGLRRRNQE
ncbi:hypothetical protein EDD11_005023 [Mortierella claussenii]|nr:hypothetical protein EDD11_005023 [Mortierella claussenii]